MTAIEHAQNGDLAVTAGYTRDQVDLIKRTIAEDTTDDELAMFMQVAQRTGLDPFARQIYAIVRNDNRSPTGKKMTIQVSIDGQRLVAQRSGEYAGQVGPLWMNDDGTWVEAWLADYPPAAAKVGVLRQGFTEPLWKTVTFREYAAISNSGKPMNLWASKPATMLAKCAEAAALRAAFPAELAGLYTAEEMAQADQGPSPSQTVSRREAIEVETRDDDGPLATPERIAVLYDVIEDLDHEMRERLKHWMRANRVSLKRDPSLAQIEAAETEAFRLLDVQQTAETDPIGVRPDAEG